MSVKKLVLCGVHGTGKTAIIDRIFTNIQDNFNDDKKTIQKLFSQYHKNKGLYWHAISERNKKFSALFYRIPEQYREVMKDIPNFIEQTKKITLATYAKQLYLENLAQAQGKQAILCDRSVLDTFVYYDYFNKINRVDSIVPNHFTDPRFISSLEYIAPKLSLLNTSFIQAKSYIDSYSKIYLIAPSEREIENDGFRMTDKPQQLEIHKLFLSYFKDFNNVEIINQEDAWKEEFVDKVVSELI